MHKLTFLVAVLFTCFSLSAYAQSPSTTSADSSAILTGPRQYVKIAIGMHILDCPVLPKQLKEKLMNVRGINAYHEDQFTQSVYFDIPEGAITAEQIKAVAIHCAFPAQAVEVVMNSKPFPK